MPGLSEVEFAQRSLEQWFEGRTLVRTEAEPGARTFRDCDLGLFKSLEGSLVGIERKGPQLRVRFSNKRGFVAQLGTSSKFLRRAPGEEVKWSRARFFLDSGEVIHFQDLHMLGRIDALPAAELEARPAKRTLEPLRDGLSVEQLKAALDGSNQELMVALMDPRRIAGLGTRHAAEALFKAKLHPERVAASLTPAEWQALTRALQAVEESAPSASVVFGRAGTPCDRCKTLIQSLTQAGQATHFCPTCQPKQKKVDGDQLRKKPRPRRYRG